MLFRKRQIIRRYLQIYPNLFQVGVFYYKFILTFLEFGVFHSRVPALQAVHHSSFHSIFAPERSWGIDKYSSCVPSPSLPSYRQWLWLLHLLRNHWTASSYFLLWKAGWHSPAKVIGETAATFLQIGHGCFPAVLHIGQCFIQVGVADWLLTVNPRPKGLENQFFLLETHLFPFFIIRSALVGNAVFQSCQTVAVVDSLYNRLIVIQLLSFRDHIHKVSADNVPNRITVWCWIPCYLPGNHRFPDIPESRPKSLLH